MIYFDIDIIKNSNKFIKNMYYKIIREDISIFDFSLAKNKFL